MIVLGNTKLGRAFWSFSIPAVVTCIGATAACLANCYARSGRSMMPSVRAHRDRTLAASRRKDFVEQMGRLIRHNFVSLLRVHVEGDFYDEAYVKKWVRIAQANRNTTFLAYTRSWRRPELIEPLMEFGRLPNVRLWLSCDRDSGQPPRLDGVWGLAYMSLSDGDTPEYPADLVFRDKTTTLMKYTPQGDFVCPYEQGVRGAEKITCSRCRYCTSDEVLTRRESTGRVPLTVVG